MPDRDKVIRALEVCSEIRDYSCCPQGCPYMQPGFICNGTNDLMRDALALLREQEPVSPQKMLDGVWSFIRCGACKNVLYERGFAYCPWCGRKVKWDAND